MTGPGFAPAGGPMSAPPRRGYADGRYGQVHYQVLGDGRPLALCHQSPLSLRQFDAVYPLLADAGFTAIGIDTPGFGQSDPPPDAPFIADYAHIVPAVLDALDIARADLLGHHTGAMIATEAALRHPERVGRLVLNVPAPFTDAEAESWREDMLARERAWRPRIDGSHLAELWERRVEHARGLTPLAALQRNLVQTLIAGDTMWHGHHAAFHYDHASSLREISQPCLVLSNSGDVIHEVAGRALEIRPDFSYQELPGGTVDIVDQQPEAWTRAVAAFLLDRDARAG